MAGCGYVCPQCEGKGYTDDGAVCDWCSKDTRKEEDKHAAQEHAHEHYEDHEANAPDPQEHLNALDSGI